MIRKRTMIYGASLLILCAGFILCRYGFFIIHGMRDWPLILFLVALAVIGLSFLFKARVVPMATALAYSAGFAVGVIFQSNGADPGGGRTNSLWLIWTAVLIGVVAAAALGDLEWATKRKSSTRKHTEGEQR